MSDPLDLEAQAQALVSMYAGMVKAFHDDLIEAQERCAPPSSATPRRA